MYTPGHFSNQDKEEVKNFIRSNAFGVIISVKSSIRASHIPLELSDDGKFLSGHLSAANPQGKEFSDGQEVLCIFNGPHAYISSSWYDHENVPTWNYIAAHVYGTIRKVDGELLRQRLSHLVDKYEMNSQTPVSLDSLSDDYLQRHIRGIVAFDVEITSMEATYKLSQNRDKKNYTKIITELRKRDDINSHLIAEEMTKRAF